jgi:hypothetical protein
MDFCANVDDDAFIGTGFIDSYRPTEDFNLVHYFDCVVGVFFGLEFAEAIALVGLRDAVFGEVNAYYGTNLEH